MLLRELDKLNEDLKENVELYYSIEGSWFDQPNQHQLTHQQLLESVIRQSLIQKPKLDMIKAKAHSPGNKPSFIVLSTNLMAYNMIRVHIII